MVSSGGSPAKEDQSEELVSLKGGKEVDVGEDEVDSRWSYFWAAVGWWFVVIVSVPFAFYSAVFVYGEFSIYREMSISFVLGHFDTAGLNILHHIRAWQIHAFAAEVFLLTAPFQFSPKFRKAYPARHRQLGYAFVCATSVLIISALVSLTPNTDFGEFGAAAANVLGIVTSVFLVLAVKAAKERRFDVHQKFMIRTAALGYSVMMMRILPGFIHLLTGISLFWSFDLSVALSPLSFGILAEIYIQRFLK